MSGQAGVGCVVAALGAALAFGLASALQHVESGRVAQRGALDPGLLMSLARRPMWLVGLVADVLAVLLQAVALRLGSIALVQPLLLAGLPVAVLASRLLQRQRLGRAELLGVGLCTLGLAALAPAVSSTRPTSDPARGAAVLAAAVVAAVVLGLLLLARRRPALAGLATGAAAGAVVGSGSVLLAVCAARIDDPLRLLSGVAPYATVAVGALGLLLSQAAFQTGALSTPLAALSLAEPVVAVVLAVNVLSERLPGTMTARLSGAVGAALAVAGILVLARVAEVVRGPAPPNLPAEVGHGGAG